MANIVPATSLSAVKDPLKRSFKNFMWKTWRSLGFPDPTENHYEIADWLQYGPDKSITMGFRGLAKSYITVDFALWVLYGDPDEIVLATSATTNAAKQNSTFAWQMLINFDWLAHMIPTSDQRQSVQAFDVRGATPKKMESFRAESLFGQLPGLRATLSIPDDIEIPNNSDTDAKRAELRRRFGEISGAILLPGGREKVLGTAQNEQSIYTELAQEKGYGMRMWPIVYPSIEELPKFGPWLSPKVEAAIRATPELAGTSTEPSRFSDADIAERERVWGRTEFARQFKLHLDAGAGRDAPLKLRDFMVMEWAPPSGGPASAPSSPAASSGLLLPPEVRWAPSKDLLVADLEFDSLHGDALYEPAFKSPQEKWLPTEALWMYVDPSGEGTDETVWAVAAALGALTFVCDMEASIEGHTYETLKRIAAMAKRWGAGMIHVESNFGQGMFSGLLRPCLAEISHPASIEEDRKGGISKERRIIETLEPPLTSHRVVLNKSILRRDFSDSIQYPTIEDARRRFYRLTYQITRITRVKGCISKDDRVDDLASLVAKNTERMQMRAEDAAKMDREAALQREIEEMIAERVRQGLPTYGAENLTGMPLGRPIHGRKGPLQR